MEEVTKNKNSIIFSNERKKLSRIFSSNRLKLNNRNIRKTRNKIKIIHKSMSKDNLSVLLFQSNDVDLVRNLDPYEEKDIMSNILLKGKLKNDIIKKEEYNMQTSKRGKNDLNLPKINKMTINRILESENKLNQNKKEALKNLAYSQLESELCKELKKLKQQHQEKKEEKDNIYLNFKKIKDEIDEINLDIQTINYREFFANLRKDNEKFKKKNVVEKSISEIKKGNSENKEDSKSNNDSSENKLIKLKKMQTIKKEQDYNKKLKYDRLNLLKSQLSNLREPLINLNKELNEIKKKEKEITHKLMAHYESLLFKGEEVRSEGLIWIIKAMWNLKENVPMSFIPPFLDFQSIEFLFQYAHKSIELENTKKILNELKNKLQIKLHKLFYSSNPKEKYSSSFEFKTGLIKQNSISKGSIKDHIFINSYINADDNEENDKNINIGSLKRMSKIFERQQNYISLKNLEGIDKIEELKIKIKKIEEEMSNLKKNEIFRLFKEFAENDYENKYHVSIDKVLAAVVGEHGKNIETNRYSKYKKEYFDELKNIRFYQYGQDKSSFQ